MVDKQAVAKILGANLKRLREESNLSMQALANIAEVEKSQIVRVENGQVDARVSTLYVLATALKTDVCEFFKPIKEGLNT